MNCNGKCYLKKQLNQASNQETQSTQGSSYKVLQEEIQSENYRFNFTSYKAIQLSDFYFYSEKVPSGFLRQPTPPPQLG